MVQEDAPQPSRKERRKLAQREALRAEAAVPRAVSHDPEVQQALVARSNPVQVLNTARDKEEEAVRKAVPRERAPPAAAAARSDVALGVGKKKILLETGFRVGGDESNGGEPQRRIRRPPDAAAAAAAALRARQ